ncbi:hypothetical protein ACIGCP_18430 [Cellulophaga baltica]|uniref:hypothetical protein n=1 Tax=Cellulophaga baltica TaxID=76594 RepID=UPI0037C6AFEE
MNKIILLLILTSWSVKAQINSKIEGITINSPCELEYTRNLGNQNNYTCPYQYGNGKLDNFSVTVTNLQTDMVGMTGNSMDVYKKTFLETIKSNSESNGETARNMEFSNGIKAVSSISYLTYGDQKFKNIAIAFLYKQKSFIVNLTTNNLTRNNEIEELIDKIIFK